MNTMVLTAYSCSGSQITVRAYYVHLALQIAPFRPFRHDPASLLCPNQLPLPKQG